MDTDVYGISLDGVADLAKFHKAQKLTYPLLSDPDGSVAGRFDAVMKGRPFAKRMTFIIDGEGILRHIDEGVNVRTHGEDLLAIVERLQNE
ncbi:MAG: peroxiredoxin Q/BCP [Planctomycetota bacterium]|jgi:peroxiredoxin Q/BCP